MKCDIKIIREGAKIPTKAHGMEDAGWDLYYCGPDKTVLPDRIYNLPTGICISPEYGYWTEVCQRSSAHDKGYGVLRGIIDNGYRGEIIIRLMPFKTMTIAANDRIAQMIFHEIMDVQWQLTDALPTSRRGEKGFGSSGD